jgi:peroxiredoxin family protein
MRQRIVILGGGTGGTLLANRLRRLFRPGAAEIDEGFFIDPGQWTEDMAPQIASAEGLTELTDRHWQVIKFMRHEYETKGTGPMVDQLDISSIPEFVEMIADTGAGLYGRKASGDLFGLTKDDLIDQVKDIITVGEFYDLAAGGETIFYVSGAPGMEPARAEPA